MWRPKVAFEELKANEHKNDLTRALDQNGCLKTVEEQGQNCCAFLNPGTNKCGIYACRPFECRLYPFLLTRSLQNGCVGVSIHLSCPYVQEFRHSSEFEKHADILKAYLSGGERARFLSNNPALAGDYSEYRGEIEGLFTLEKFQRENLEPA